MWVTKQLLVPTDFDNKKKEVTEDQQLFSYPHSLKYLLLYSAQE